MLSQDTKQRLAHALTSQSAADELESAIATNQGSPGPGPGGLSPTVVLDNNSVTPVTEADVGKLAMLRPSEGAGVFVYQERDADPGEPYEIQFTVNAPSNPGELLGFSDTRYGSVELESGVDWTPGSDAEEEAQNAGAALQAEFDAQLGAGLLAVSVFANVITVSPVASGDITNFGLGQPVPATYDLAATSGGQDPIPGGPFDLPVGRIEGLESGQVLISTARIQIFQSAGIITPSDFNISPPPNQVRGAADGRVQQSSSGTILGYPLNQTSGAGEEVAVLLSSVIAIS